MVGQGVGERGRVQRWAAVAAVAAVVVTATTITVATRPVGAATSTTGTCHLAVMTTVVTHSVIPVNVDTGAMGTPIVLPFDVPSSVAVSADGARAIVSGAAGGIAPFVVSVDLRTGTVGAALPVTSTGQVSITPDSATALVLEEDLSSGRLDIVDLATNTLRATVAFATPPMSLVLTSDAKTAQVSVGGALIPVDLATATTGPAIGGAPSITFQTAISPDDHIVWSPHTTNGNLVPIDLVAKVAQAPVAVGTAIAGVAATPDGATVLLSTPSTPPSLIAVDTTTRTVRASVPLGVPAPGRLTVPADGEVALVIDANNNQIVPFALPALTIGTPISAGPSGAFAPTTPVAAAFVDHPPTASVFDAVANCPPPTTTTSTSTSTTTTAPAAVKAATSVAASPGFTG